MSEIRWNSQSGEDRWIYDNLKPRVGKFIEIGAFDGIKSSNTIAFEDMGWDGICVEADPYLAGQCQVNRKCQTICAGVGDDYVDSPLMSFQVNREDRGLSGFSQQWGSKIWVPKVALNHIVNILNGCDLLSIDTEGTETEVWCSGDWEKHLLPVTVIMEHQTRDLPSNEEFISSVMFGDGYTLVHKTAHNLIFSRI